MRLTLRQLQIFTAIASTGSTTAAAQLVALSQSATSNALNELEGLLDARLFDRIGKRLVLNDVGRALLPQVRALLDSAMSIESQFGMEGGGRSGNGYTTQLRIGASTTIGNYLLPGIIASYLNTLPEPARNNPYIDVSIGNSSEIAAIVARMEVDVGLIEGPCHEPDLEARPWLEDKLVIVCSPFHPLAKRDMRSRVVFKELRQQRWLLREPGSGTREVVEGALLPHLHQWEQSMQLGSTESIKQAAAEGLGITCLSLCAVQDLIRLQRLVVVNTSLPRLTRRFYLIHHRKKQFSSSLLHFVDHCLKAID
jgi:DNA-binding transcriptional LysR family regulator